MDIRFLSYYWVKLQKDMVSQLGPDIGLIAAQQVMQGWADAMSKVELDRIIKVSK